MYTADKTQNVRGGGKPVRMNQFLRAAFADALNNPTRDDTLNHFSHCHLLQHRHLSGMNFPREIHHDFHPGYDHTLVLKPFQLANDDEQFHCAACGVDDSELSLFQSYYCCDSCNFNLHVECASIPTTLNLKVKYPLHLFFSLTMNGKLAAALSCSICTKVVPTSGCWVFYNHDHVYLCHFDCAAIIEFSMETNSLAQLQNRLQTLAITNRPPARASRPSVGITHFTHRHSLKEYGSAKSLRCSLCNFALMKGAPKTLTLANVNYKLFFSFPFKHEKATIRCNICFEKVMTTCSLLYYNMDSDETMHVSCALFEESVSNHEEMVNRLSIQRLSDLRIAD
ncbi:hypothetical protein RDI58_028856 [Solanum bulbocastanum]|uniref:DC1 domain-containing protein n=1 Tax=Solanum bulbocastanum TaxID=147425 RepID=A0AAN8SWE4_SOLBU